MYVIRSRWVALLAVCMAGLAMPLSFTGPAIALTAISQTLGGDPVALSWVCNAFMLGFGSTLLAAGSLADRLGRRRVFLVGTALFCISSVALSLSSSLSIFLILRVIQGVAASMAFASGLAALTQLYSDHERLHAFSLIGTSFGAGLAFGPLLAGWLTDMLGWPALFVCVATIALLSFLLGRLALRHSASAESGPADIGGAITFTLGLCLLTLAIIQYPLLGLMSAEVLGLLLLSFLTFGLFVRIELRAQAPLLTLSLLQSGRFLGVQVLAMAPAYAFVVLLIMLPIRMVGVEGMTEVSAGQMMMAMTLPLLVLPPAAARLTNYCSPALLCASGFLLAATGLCSLSFCPSLDGSFIVMTSLALIGVGISLPWGLMDGLAVSVVEPEQAGMAAGIFSTCRIAGEGVALAVTGSVLVSLLNERLSFVAGESTHVTNLAVALAMGETKHVLAQLPAMSRSSLLQLHADAWHSLLLGLAAVTCCAATLLWLLLREGAQNKSI